MSAAKRQYGNFCLPLLYRDEFVGRMNCKVHRKDRLLEIKSLRFEQHRYDEDRMVAAFAEAVTQFCQFQQCDPVRLTEVHPRHLAQRLRSAIALTE